MPRFFLLFLLCCGFAGPAAAQTAAPAPVYLTKDSLPGLLGTGWRYSPGDNPAWARPEFPDSGWVVATSGFDPEEAKSPPYPGIGWWRRRITIDSSLAGKPLGAIIRQDGASEFYLDGVLKQEFGSIRDSGGSIDAWTSGGEPFVIVLPRAGTYLFALRVADPHPDWLAGFSLKLDFANRAVIVDRSLAVAFTGMSAFLFGVFLAFAALHGILFLYRRRERSNLWFSVFCLSLAGLLLLIYAYVSQRPAFTRALDYSSSYMALLCCFSLSGFIGSVFFRRRSLVRIGILLAVPATFISSRVEGTIVDAAGIAVAIETVIVIGTALYRRRPGAKIIAAGMLLFAVMLLFMLTLILTGSIGQNVTLLEPKTFLLVVLGFIALLSMPISMSTYLARNYAAVSRNLESQLAEVERLSAEKLRLQEHRQEELEREVAVRTEELRGQKQKSDNLLLNILPAEVAEELKENGRAAARLYADVSVLFTDFVDFTKHSERLSPEALVAEIDTCFRAFDAIIEKHGLEKIKTVGDAYIAVSGMPAENEFHARDVVRAGLDIAAFMAARLAEKGAGFGIRLGVHSGPVVAGIVGVKKFAYDIWGDTVNTAARMEQHSEPGRLNISGATRALLQDEFVLAPRGELAVKNKGRMHMYFVAPPGQM